MAQVAAKVMGGSLQELDAETVGELKDIMGLEGTYSAQVNGESADDETQLRSRDFVTFTKSVKGGKSL